MFSAFVIPRFSEPGKLLDTIFRWLRCAQTVTELSFIFPVREAVEYLTRIGAQ
jgi:hypothetical protein